MMLPGPLDALLPQLQQEDGRLWVRILGQAHWQYEELAIWVLVENREQIAEALAFLQRALTPLRSVPDAKVTVAFMGMTRTQEFGYGMFKGDEFFATDALGCLYDEPFENPRTANVFDIRYPNDPYAIVDEEWLRARGRR